MDQLLILEEVDWEDAVDGQQADEAYPKEVQAECAFYKIDFCISRVIRKSRSFRVFTEKTLL